MSANDALLAALYQLIVFQFDLCGNIYLMLTDQQKQNFREHGFIRISNALSKDEVNRTANYLWLKLERFGIQKDRPETWEKPKPKGIQSLSKTAIFDSLFEDIAREYLDLLLGKNRWEAPAHWGQVLLSLPTDKEWCVPNKNWHLDISQDISDIRSPGIQLFACIEDVKPKCGATVVVSGSHQILGEWFRNNGIPEKNASSSALTKLGESHEWFQLLRSKDRSTNREERLLNLSRTDDGVPLQVCELTGNRGDLILMHPYLAHASAPNIGPNIRLVLTQRIYSY